MPFILKRAYRVAHLGRATQEKVIGLMIGHLAYAIYESNKHMFYVVNLYRHHLLASLEPAALLLGLKSQLNGSQGEVTGTDDHDEEVPPCPIPLQRCRLRHFHPRKRTRGAGDQDQPEQKREALTGAEKRMAEKVKLCKVSKLTECADVDCNRAVHYHIPAARMREARNLVEGNRLLAAALADHEQLQADLQGAKADAYEQRQEEGQQPQVHIQIREEGQARANAEEPARVAIQPPPAHVAFRGRRQRPPEPVFHNVPDAEPEAVPRWRAHRDRVRALNQPIPEVEELIAEGLILARVPPVVVEDANLANAPRNGDIVDNNNAQDEPPAQEDLAARPAEPLAAEVPVVAVPPPLELPLMVIEDLPRDHELQDAHAPPPEPEDQIGPEWRDVDSDDEGFRGREGLFIGPLLPPGIANRDANLPNEEQEPDEQPEPEDWETDGYVEKPVKSVIYLTKNTEDIKLVDSAWEAFMTWFLTKYRAVFYTESTTLFYNETAFKHAFPNTYKTITSKLQRPGMWSRLFFGSKDFSVSTEVENCPLLSAYDHSMECSVFPSLVEKLRMQFSPQSPCSMSGEPAAWLVAAMKHYIQTKIDEKYFGGNNAYPTLCSCLFVINELSLSFSLSIKGMPKPSITKIVALNKVSRGGIKFMGQGFR